MYTVLLRQVCPKDEDRMSMQLLFGYVGLLNMISHFPVAVWLVASSCSSGDGISPSQVDLLPEDGLAATTAMMTTTTLLLLRVVAGTDTL